MVQGPTQQPGSDFPMTHGGCKVGFWGLETDGNLSMGSVTEWAEDTHVSGEARPGGARPSEGGLGACARRQAPFLRVVHEEEVEQAQAGLRQPREPVLQVVVWLSPQAVLADQRQLGEALQEPREGRGAEARACHGTEGGAGAGTGGAGGGLCWARTGQMFSLGVPSSCTIRSTW